MEFDKRLVDVMLTEIKAINQLLYNHRVEAGIIPSDVLATPTFIRYGVTLGKGIKASAVLGLQREISIAIGKHRRIKTSARIEDMPLAIEVPHPTPEILTLDQASIQLPEHTILLGRSFVDGRPRDEVVHLDESPHLLVAGITGSGKSVLVTSGVLTICEYTPPDALKLHLIDLKNEDAVPLKLLPHVETFAGDIETAVAVLDRIHGLQTERIKLDPDPDTLLVRHLLVIDELSELARNKTAMATLARLLAIGRSLKLNIIAATQHPLANVISSIVKANFSTRLVGMVNSPEASKVATGRHKIGAEFLAGNGAFIRVEGPHVTRLQTFYVPSNQVSEYVDRIQELYPGHSSQATNISSSLPIPTPTDHLPELSNIQKLALQESVVTAFNQYYDPARHRLKHGGLNRVIEAIYGSGAYSGGWNRTQALAVVDYLTRLDDLVDG